MRLLSLKTVLAAADFDPSSRPALESALALAESSGAAFHIAHVSDAADATAAIEAALERLDIPRNRAVIHHLTGDAARAIGALADNLGADALVLGPHRQRADSANTNWLGGTALALVTIAAVPCLVTRRALTLPLNHVVVAIDSSDAARGALTVGLSWASALRTATSAGTAPTKITAVNVRCSAAPRPEALVAEIERMRDDAGSWAGVSIEAVWASGDDPAAEIAGYAIANDVDLVVLGTRGSGMNRAGPLGSVSAAVMQRVDAPVLLVPPAIWTSLAPS